MQTEVALRAHGRRLARAVAYGAVLVVLTLTALGFAVAGLYMALATAMGGAAAAALTALLLLAAASVVELARRARRPAPAPSPSAAMSHDLATMVREKPLEAVLLALTTGMTAAPRGRTDGTTMTMKHGAIALALAGFVLAGCSQQQLQRGGELLAISDEQAQQLGDETWQRIRAERPASTNQQWQQRLRAIGQRLVAANNFGQREWDFVVLQGEEVNAFALPGGHIAFYEGMMKLAANDAQIAAVMGHEIGHVTESHSAERVGLAQTASAGLQAVSVALQAGNVAYANQIAGVLGAGAQYGLIMPYSRGQESEADDVGLIYMARAGYDPRQAVAFWQRMKQASKGAPPEMLSTHPAPDSRIAALNKRMPEAMAIYQKRR